MKKITEYFLKIVRIVNTKSALLPLVTIFIWIMLGFLSPVFLTSSNLFRIAVSMATIALLAIGQTFVILTAGIDLSVGSILGLTQVAVVFLMFSGIGMIPAALLGLLIGAACGALNGLVITKGLPPFIVTLGTMGIFRGIALIVTNAFPVRLPYREFEYLATGKLGDFFPIPVLLLVFLYTVAAVILKRTRFGLHVYATGSNEEGAIYTGVRTNLIKIAVYSISGLTAAFASLVHLARVVSAYPSAGEGAELDAIAAVVIGGTSFFGGSGNIVLTFVGAIIMGTLRNGSNLLGISAYMQQVIIGSIIIVAVYFSARKRGP